MSGWYPDPGGERDRYRYWDGAHWSDETVADPSGPPPVPSTSTGRATGTRTAAARRPPAALIVLLAVIVMGTAVTIFLIREYRSGRPYTNEPLPTASVSGWDDSSATPSPPRAPTASASPAGDGLCVEGQPNTRDYAPADGRVHGGNLSFPAASELDPATDEPRFSFAWDVSQQIRGVHERPGWIAQLAVGQVRAEDGFDDGVRRVAEQIIRCTVTSNMYEPYDPTRKDRRSAAVTVDGVNGWLIETDVTVKVSGLPFSGDRVHLIVVPDRDNFAFFFSATPIGDDTLDGVAQRAQDALTVS